jgi:hypothetical protein
VPQAREELRKTVGYHGRLEPEARQLLGQIDALPPGKDRPPDR